jgi:hypothetical protein
MMAAAVATHLIVLVSGMLSWPEWPLYQTVVLQYQLQNDLPADATHVHMAQACQGFDTRLGIHVCGRRLVDEICALRQPHHDRVSFIGISLGGLVARAAIAFGSSDDDRLCGMRYAHYISLGSPHLGVRIGMPAWQMALVRGGVLGETGRQLALQGSAQDWHLDHLLWGSSSGALLSAFETRTAVYNAQHDSRVPAYSAGISAPPSCDEDGDNNCRERDMANKFNAIGWRRIVLDDGDDTLFRNLAHSISSCSSFAYQRWIGSVYPHILGTVTAAAQQPRQPASMFIVWAHASIALSLVLAAVVTVVAAVFALTFVVSAVCLVRVLMQQNM